ncbi:PLP-dependent aminotransferase family protein [Pseudomonas xantholysinigenes]|uniref:PLP-dependent aminotransferase family protein n=1 Tax=Pseudomonas xantholysinigenes TaxID=2745490 RepID=A0A9E6TVE1_9PSED|nr:PLP-dependent aminotransferase family protein [Pseudomonas xantholysinigenes]QXI36339.1 PLP-dependent aminotransferase family protein [Pseudomonas xantholysinigenes]
MDTERTPRFTYQKVHRYLSDWLDARASAQAHRLPSLRQVARHLRVSLSSSKQAFALLEAQGRIQARPKIGYFSVARDVAAAPANAALIDRVYLSARQPGMLALSSDAPSLLANLNVPLLTLERALSRQLPHSDTPPFSPCGDPELRQALAARYSRDLDHHWQADQVFIGSELRSVLLLALRTLLPMGARVLVESPCSWLVLRLLQTAGLETVEMPLGREGCFDLEAMAHLLATAPVQAALLSSTVNVPQGGLMPAQDKQQVCTLLAEHGVWLLENDTYGDLCGDPALPRYRDFADPQRLLVFASLDKCLGAEAPFGYLLCRGGAAVLEQAFLVHGFRLPACRQQAIARLLAAGRLERHLAELARQLAASRARMAALLHRHAGDCLRLTSPVAGAAFWLQATRGVDMQGVCERLLTQGIVIAPGTMFSQTGHWRDHLRLSFTVDWGQDIEGAVVSLAQAIREAPQQP